VVAVVAIIAVVTIQGCVTFDGEIQIGTTISPSEKYQQQRQGTLGTGNGWSFRVGLIVDPSR
jgi:hypothetical protein